MTRSAQRPMVKSFFDHPAPLAFAHRGYSPAGLENTMRAFAAAVELGYRYVETDVRVTADGTAVTFHDARMDRLTEHSGRIRNLTWAEVRTARVHGIEPIPTVEEALHAFPQLRWNIDVKDPAAVGPFARAIERTAAHDRVCVASFSDRRRRAVLLRLSRPVATSGGRQTIARFRAASALRLSTVIARLLREVDCLQLPPRVGGLRLVTRSTVTAVHAAGRQLHVWTVNDPAEMRRMLALDVDGLMTDRADLLRDLLTAENLEIA
jgi:glycerophosphoryl diester phosphodiesterase